MDSMNQTELQALLTATGSGLKASLYMPAVKAGQETRQNSIRFKNLLRELENQLAALGARQSEVEKLLAPAKALVDDYEFWQHTGRGFAIFLAPDFHRHYHLAIKFDELAIAGERFYLKPLLRLFSQDQQFYVLALSQNAVRLLAADPHSVSEIDLEDTPTSLEDALGHQLSEQQLQFHSGDAGADPVYHAQGSGQDDIKPEISKFFSLVDKAVTSRIGAERRPLVLAGVEYVLALYRGVTDYQPVLDKSISGNHDHTSAEELRASAWEIAASYFQTAVEQTVERYRALAADGRASAQLEDIVAAAVDGRIDTLLVARGERRWGRYDPGDRRIERHEEQSPASEDLLDLAAVNTYMQSGQVFICEPHAIPDRAPAAAIYRY